MAKTDKTVKALKKHIFATIWALLAAFLMLGLFAHQNDWNQFWALWGTEILAFGLVAFYLWKPTAISAFAMFAGSGVWLLNQVVGWYSAQLFAFIGGQMQLQTMTIVNIITFVAEAGLFYYAFAHRKGSAAPPFKFASPQTTALFGFILMFLFAGWKTYWMYTTQAWRNTTPIYISGMTWAVGIAVMAAASIINLKFTRKENTIIMLVGVVGLLVATYAALYYGLGLALTGI